jgi:hypothetical protein
MGPYEKVRDELTTGQRHFSFLNAAQLVKHAFGLRTQANKNGKLAKLVYLYAEPKHYPDGRSMLSADIIAHRKEVGAFANAIATTLSDVEFFCLTYSELLKSWARSNDRDVRIHSKLISQHFDI